MLRVLVTYASKKGCTWQIAQAIANTIRNEGLIVHLAAIEKVNDVSIYDGVVIGSAIYTGRWMKEAVDFVTTHEAVLMEKRVWFFSSGPTGEGDPVELLDGWTYPPNLETSITRIQPQDVAVFHGCLDPDDLDFFSRLIVKVSKSPAGDYRQWETIHDWAREVANTTLAIPQLI
jgi:menaquinone-dependent protoporphyrinogen oxidase